MSLNRGQNYIFVERTKLYLRREDKIISLKREQMYLFEVRTDLEM